MLSLSVSPHPLLDAAAFVTTFPRPLSDLPRSAEIDALLSPAARAPLAADDAVRSAVRDLLRAGGFKPTGRSKPASEYLVRASAEGALSSINLAVDACNAVSLHSGLPISVVDLDKAREPLSIAVAGEGASYVFNASGQIIDIGGLLCLFDGEGPCANAVKDAQRTKTHPGTTRTLSVVWGTRALAGRSQAASSWYRELLEKAGAKTEDVALLPRGATCPGAGGAARASTRGRGRGFFPMAARCRATVAWGFACPPARGRGTGEAGRGQKRWRPRAGRARGRGWAGR